MIIPLASRWDAVRKILLKDPVFEEESFSRRRRRLFWTDETINVYYKCLPQERKSTFEELTVAPKQGSRAGGAPIMERNSYWRSVLTGLAAQRLLVTLPPVCVNENQITTFLSPRSSCSFHVRPNKRWGLIGAKAIHLLSMPHSWLFTALARHTVRPIFLCMSVSLCQGFSSSRYPCLFYSPILPLEKMRLPRPPPNIPHPSGLCSIKSF